MDELQSEAPVKLYYRIGEVAAIVGVEPHVLRYWETEFRSIRPQKSRKGQRIYSRRDVERLLRVKDLLYNQGFTIAGARKRLRDPAAQLQAEPQAALEAEAKAAPLSDLLPPPVHVETRRSAPPRWRQTLLDARRELAALLAEIDRA